MKIFVRYYSIMMICGLAEFIGRDIVGSVRRFGRYLVCSWYGFFRGRGFIICFFVLD